MLCSTRLDRRLEDSLPQPRFLLRQLRTIVREVSLGILEEAVGFEQRLPTSSQQTDQAHFSLQID